MANRIVLNTISYHGAGAIAEISGELQRRGYKKVFVCTDPDLVKFGVAAKVTDLLDEAGIAYSVYSDIKPNPTIQNVTDGVEAFKAAEADSIVTIGGGSAMDTAKASASSSPTPSSPTCAALRASPPPRTTLCSPSPCPPPPAPQPRSPSTTSSPTWRRSASSCASTPTTLPRSPLSIRR